MHEKVIRRIGMLHKLNSAYIKFKNNRTYRREYKMRTQILFMIIVVNILIFILGIVGMNLLPENHGKSSSEIIKYSLKLLVDSGGFMDNTTNVLSVVLTVVIVLAGMICFTGGIIAYMSNMVTSLVDNADKGTNKIELANHIIILNWNNEVPLLIADYLRQKERQYIVVLSNNNKDEILSEINKKIHDLQKEEKEALNFDGKVPRVIIRQTNNITTKDFDDVCVTDAASILIVSPKDNNSADGCDAIVIKQYMLLISYLSEFLKDDEDHDLRNELGITVEIQKAENLKCVNDYPVPLDDGEKSIIPVGVNCNEILGKIMALSVVKPSLHVAINELLSFRGSEIYARVPVDDNCDYNMVQDHIIPFDKQLVTRDFSIPLFELPNYYRAFLLENSKFYSYDVDIVSDDTQRYFSDFSSEDVTKWILKKEPKEHLTVEESIFTNNILIIGENERLKYILFELVKLTDRGLSVSLAYIDESQKNIVNDLVQKSFSEYKIDILDLSLEMTDLDITKLLSGYSDILILSDPDDEIMEDRIPLMLWNVLRRNKVEDVKIHFEVLNPTNKDIVKSEMVEGNYFISNQYISGMFTQLGSDPNLYKGIMELLTLESNQNIWTYQAQDIIPSESMVFETKKEFVLWMYRYSEKKLIPIGIIRKGKTYLLTNGNDLNETYIYDADVYKDDLLAKRNTFEIYNDDEIIVIERIIF